MRNLIKKNPKYSKRINYNALKELFTDEGPSFHLPGADDDKDDDGGLYTMDDKSDGEGMLIVEEGGGGVGQARQIKSKSRSASLVPGAPGSAIPAPGKGLADIHEGDEEEDAEGEEDVEEDGEKDDTYGEWDAYEQEV